MNSSDPARTYVSFDTSGAQRADIEFPGTPSLSFAQSQPAGVLTSRAPSTVVAPRLDLTGGCVDGRFVRLRSVIDPQPRQATANSHRITHMKPRSTR